MTHSTTGALPARHTDFIFAVCGEELGMVGCLLLLLLLSLIILRCIWVARNASSPFHAYVSMGMAGMLLIQVAANVGMCLFVFPVMVSPSPSSATAAPPLSPCTPHGHRLQRQGPKPAQLAAGPLRAVKRKIFQNFFGTKKEIPLFFRIL